ncbi:site-specific integrase [Cryptosporangium arvum]|uniref:site-specific integrase n=1 Tax=Cryptosporangium arvum TaxID=80871 RepID=UPI0004B2C516|nr:tyrosine-type recombinase/integrase [Cryptosporangium arvum]
MGRPPLEVGTAGIYRIYPTRRRAWKARAYYRDYDGVTREITRVGKTKGQACRALDIAVRDRIYVGGGADLGPDSLVTVVAAAWLTELENEGKGVSTLQQYAGNIERCLKPGIGGLRIRELDKVATCDRYLSAVKAQRGAATAKTARSVLSGICGYAARHDLLGRNAVRDTGTISVKPKKMPSALTVEQVLDLRIWLTYDDRAIKRDVPDLVAFMLATGLRISEASAVHWEDLDLGASTVRVRATSSASKALG